MHSVRRDNNLLYRVRIKQSKFYFFYKENYIDHYFPMSLQRFDKQLHCLSLLHACLQPVTSVITSPCLLTTHLQPIILPIIFHVYLQPVHSQLYCSLIFHAYLQTIHNQLHCSFFPHLQPVTLPITFSMPGWWVGYPHSQPICIIVNTVFPSMESPYYSYLMFSFISSSFTKVWRVNTCEFTIFSNSNRGKK